MTRTTIPLRSSASQAISSATAIFGVVGPAAGSRERARIAHELGAWLARIRQGRPKIEASKFSVIGWFGGYEEPRATDIQTGEQLKIIHGRSNLADQVRLTWGSSHYEEFTLRLCRTGHGAIPMFWTRVGCGMAFCTNDSALREVLHAPFDERYVLDSIVQSYSAHGSLFKGGFPVPAGGEVRATIRSRSSECDICETVLEEHAPQYEPLMRGKSGEGYIERASDSLHTALCTACERCLPPSGAVHMLLSDGIDSNVVASVIRRECGRDVVGHRFLENDEDIGKDSSLLRHYRRLGIVLEIHRFSDHSIWDLSAEAARIHGGVLPFLHAGVRLGLGRCFSGITDVVLTGEGSDEYFYGYPYYFSGKASRGPSARQKPDLMQWNTASTRAERNPRQSLIDRMTLRLHSLLAVGHPTASLEAGPVRESTRNELLDLQARCDRQSVLSNYSLRFLGNQLDQANSVTSCCPFLEPEVTHAARQCPPELHLLDGRGKFLLRRMAKEKGLVPRSVIEGQKRAFIRGIRQGSPWLDYACVTRTMINLGTSEGGLFDWSSVRDLISRVESGTTDVLDQMLLVAIWHTQLHLDARPAEVHLPRLRKAC